MERVIRLPESFNILVFYPNLEGDDGESLIFLFNNFDKNMVFLAWVEISASNKKNVKRKQKLLPIYALVFKNSWNGYLICDSHAVSA